MTQPAYRPLPGFARHDAWWQGALKPFRAQPTLLVVHSGDVRAGLAEYMVDPRDRAGAKGAVQCHDGRWRRQVATHGAWHAGMGQLVQCVSLALEGWGTGAAKWRGTAGNRIAYHVELPGPWRQERDGVQVAELVRFALALKLAVPTVCWWCRHSDLDPQKRDPGPGLSDDWAGGVLEYAPR